MVSQQKKVVRVRIGGRTAMIRSSVLPSEFDQIKFWADSLGDTPSQFVREAAMSRVASLSSSDSSGELLDHMRESGCDVGDSLNRKQPT